MDTCQRKWNLQSFRSVFIDGQCAETNSQVMGGVDLKEQLLHMYMVEREKNDQMVPQTFQKATELYSSQFVCCLSTSDWKKYTAALVWNLASGRSVYRICACCGDAECTGATGIRQHNSTADWKTFSEKSGAQNWKIKTSEEVCCVFKERKKRKLQCTAAKYVMWAFDWKIVLSCITRRSITEVFWAVLHEDQLLRCFELYYTKINYWGVLSCITRRSITEVMTIILLHLYSFKISLLKF